MERKLLEQAEHKAYILTTALPYIRDFNHKVVVIAYGCGTHISETSEQELMQDIVLLQAVGMKPVVVHSTPDGTDPFRENKRIAKLLEQCKTRAIGICGVDEKTLHMTLDHGYIPVIVPNDIDNEQVVIDPRDTALEIAVLLQADKLIYLCKHRGVWKNEERADVYSRLTLDKMQSLIAEGRVSPGIMPYIDRGVSAVKREVSRVHILDGRIRHVLLLELFSVAGAGTILIKDESKLYIHEAEE